MSVRKRSSWSPAFQKVGRTGWNQHRLTRLEDVVILLIPHNHPQMTADCLKSLFNHLMDVQRNMLQRSFPLGDDVLNPQQFAMGLMRRFQKFHLVSQVIPSKLLEIGFFENSVLGVPKPVLGN